MAQGDVPVSPGGPLRRRREKRQLEQLAEEVARREPSQIAARTHVSLLGDQATLRVQGSDGHEPDAAPEESGEMRPRGFHVHPVPIDEPFSETPPNAKTASEASSMISEASPETP